MPVIETPSIWDYIANAGGQAIGSYKEAKDKVRQDAAQNAGLLTQLFGAGAIDSSTLQPAISKIPGMGQVKVQPNAAEKQRTPGTPEATEYAARGDEASQKVQKADVLKRWSAGQSISEQEALLAGVPTQQDMALAKSAKVDASLDQAGKQYVDAEFLSKGGRINPHDAIDIAANAYQKYVRDYQAAGLGTLTPAQLQNAQRYFASRAMDRLTEQRKLDVEATAAANRGQTNALSREDKMFSNLTGLIESNRKAQADFIKDNVGVEAQSGKPDAQITPYFKPLVARLRALRNRETELQQAQGQAAMGVIPKNFAHLLSDDGSGGNGGGQPIDNNKVQILIARIKANPKLRPQLDAGLKSNTINQDEYNAVIAQLGAKK